MLRYHLVLLILVFNINDSFSQNIISKNTGSFSGIYSEPLFLSTKRADHQIPQWHYSFQSLYNKSKSKIGHTATLKDQKMNEKLALINDQTENPISNKIIPSNPFISNNFKGNELKTWTPTDNTIAISNGGIIVSCINYGIEYYRTDGTPVLQNQTWTDFINNNLLDQAKFDPRVLYDNKHDKFILVILHGFSSATSKILVCFSKTNDPMDGWNIYQMSGNPFQDTSWSDYPNIGINDDELFINLNRFGDAPDYAWHKTYIYQIGLEEGYAGTTLQYGLWNNIYTPDTQDGITLVSASDGMGKSLKDQMYFVQLMPDSGSHVYLYKINGQLNDPGKSLSVSSYPIPHFEVCANALERNPTTGDLDSLSTGAAWVQNAFYLNGIVHYTHSADMGNGWCGLSYGRINIPAGSVETSTYGEQGTDMAYPAVAAFGQDINEQQAVIAYLRSDDHITPECGVISINQAMEWSQKQTVKSGDTVVNILYPPDYANQPERWGDYTGICRRYNGTFPEVWMGAAYGANTPPRPASYGTWIAKITAFHDPQKEVGELLYPNPVVDMFTLEFENDEAGIVTVQLFDASGRLINTLFKDHLKVSKNSISFNSLVLPTGSYYIRANRGSKELFVKKFVIKNK